MNTHIKKLDPGSEAARSEGCTCDAEDNNHGEGAYSLNGVPQYFIAENCPIHNTPRTYRKDADDGR